MSFLFPRILHHGQSHLETRSNRRMGFPLTAFIEETLALYVITTFRHSLSILGLVEYNIVTLLFPATWVFANAAFAIMLMVRRRAIQEPVAI